MSEKGEKGLSRPSRGELINATPSDIMGVKHGFGSDEEIRAVEVSAAAMAARERAQIESMCVIAQRAPKRNWEEITNELMTFCQNDSFADEAVWERPVGREKDEETGKWVDVIGQGFSIRFAEAAVAAMGHVYTASDIVSELEHSRILRTVVMDVQRNNVIVLPDAISKYQERRSVQDGDVVVNRRPNSKGDMVYTIPAPEDQVRAKMNSALSKTRRNGLLSFLPAHVKQQCWETLEETFAKALQGDKRQKTLNKIVTSFDALGVTAIMLQEFLGHAISAITDEEVNLLRGVRNQLSDKATSWADIMQAKKAGEDQAKSAEQKPAETETKSDQTAQSDKSAQEAGKVGQQDPGKEQPTQDAGQPQQTGEQSGQTAQTGQEQPGQLFGSGLKLEHFKTGDDERRLKHGLKALGIASNVAQIEDYLNRWAGSKEDLLEHIESELQKKMNVVKGDTK